jgi:hypothetical protein
MLPRADRPWLTSTVLAVLGCVILVVWVQRHALFAFFSPDDLIHLQQAVGLKPILPTPLRFLSQVAYFRGMVHLFGPSPLPFHLASLITHALAVVALYSFLRSAGFTGRIALLAAVFFGMLPLHITVLSSAVGMNDEMALLLTMVAFLLTLRGRAIWGTCAYVLALLCKESVLCLPLFLLMIRRPGETFRTVWLRTRALLVVALGFGAMVLALRPVGLAPGGAVYAMGVGPHVFHNLMTYTAWAVNLRDAMPDLVSTYSTAAWRSGIIVLGMLGIAYWRAPTQRPAIGLGLAWWITGLIPVLGLRFQTYHHYLYPALPGLALAIAGLIVGLAWGASIFAARSADRRAAFVTALVSACVVGYALRANHLIATRLETFIPGTNLPLDPVIRRRVVAERAILSLAGRLNARQSRLVILSPEGTQTVRGTRSSREYPASASSQAPYDLLRESLDRGAALRVFFPQLDSVAFVSNWTPAYRDGDLFLSYPGGYLVGGGTGPQAAEGITMWMFQAGWYRPAREYLGTVVATYPDRPSLRIAYAGALFKLGDTLAAVLELEEVIRTAPHDSSASRAQMILRSLQSRR